MDALDVIIENQGWATTSPSGSSAVSSMDAD
jgi:hypothetical protein